MDGFSVPSPVTVSRRVTTDFPFLPPARVDSLAATLSVIWLFGSIILVSQVRDPTGKTLATVGAVAVGLLLVALVALQALSGPSLAVSPWGLWLRTRPGQAIWLRGPRSTNWSPSNGGGPGGCSRSYRSIRDSAGSGSAR